MPESNQQPKLSPPMQPEPGVIFGDPYMTVPQIHFAVAETTVVNLVKEGIEQSEFCIRISRAIPIIAPPEHSSDDDDDTVVETVEQTYFVSIPYTETIDGIEIPRVRTETRKRMVPIRRKKFKPDRSSNSRLVKQTYTACVPYTEQVPLADGGVMTVTRTRVETRSRMVDPDAPKPQIIPYIVSNDYPFELTKCYLPTGEQLDDEEKRRRLANPIPVLTMSDTEIGDPFFRDLLKDDAVIVVLP